MNETRGFTEIGMRQSAQKCRRPRWPVVVLIVGALSCFAWNLWKKNRG